MGCWPRNKTRLVLNKGISTLLKSSIIKDTTYIFSSKIGTTLLGFLGSIIVIRELGPVNFGLYATAVAFVPLVAGIFDLGLTTTAIKFGSLYLKQNNEKTAILFKIIGKQKIIISLVISVLGILMARFIAINLYHKPALIYPLRITMICVMTNILVTYLHTLMQTRQQFLRSSVISFITSLTRFSSILFLYFVFHLLTLKNMVLMELGLGLFSLSFCSFFLDKKFLFAKYDKNERKAVLKDIFGFSKWVMVSTFCFPLAKRLDIVMLNYYVDCSMVGIYACGLQLISPLMMLKGAMHNVLLPKISKTTSYDGYMNYIKKFTVLIVALCLTFVPAIVFASPLIEFVFGERYALSAYIFQILVAKMIFVLILNPLHMIAYSAGHPWIISGKDMFALFLNILANVILIPFLGISGAAFASLLTTVVGGSVPLLYIYFKILVPMKGRERPVQGLISETYYGRPY